MIIIINIFKGANSTNKAGKVWKDLTQENIPKKLATFKIVIMCTLFRYTNSNYPNNSVR